MTITVERKIDSDTYQILVDGNRVPLYLAGDLVRAVSKGRRITVGLQRPVDPTSSEIPVLVLLTSDVPPIEPPVAFPLAGGDGPGHVVT
jgi:hypothetical protein